jgi:hypothetical protein
LPSYSDGTFAFSALAGKGRGIFTITAVAAGDLLLVAQPLALLYCEEGTTPENEELADALAAAVAATAAAAAQAPGSSSGEGLLLWQQHALLQLQAAGKGQDSAGLEQQQQLLLQLLGNPVDVAASLQTVPTNNSSGEEASVQQPLAPLPTIDAALPGADRVLQIVHANCIGETAYWHCCSAVSGIAADVAHAAPHMMALFSCALPVCLAWFAVRLTFCLTRSLVLVVACI